MVKITCYNCGQTILQRSSLMDEQLWDFCWNCYWFMLWEFESQFGTVSIELFNPPKKGA